VLQMLRAKAPVSAAPAPSNIITIPGTSQRSGPRYQTTPSANTLPHDTAGLLCEEVVVAAPNVDTRDGTMSLTPTSVTSRWRCKVCGKETDYKSNTLRHIRVAHTANTYRCACGAEFKWSDSLKKHRRKCAAASAASAQAAVQQTSAFMASMVTAAGVVVDEQEVTPQQLYSTITG
jgi:predicted RNA-binding Zn-ribbon protein involved in translation (DUF1610 family)